MKKEETNTSKEKKTTTEKVGKEEGFRIRSARDLIDGSLLTNKAFIKQLPFLLYMFVLAIFLISNRYSAIKILKETMQIQNELKELRANAISTASELMFLSRQSQVARMVEEEGLGLRESRVPPKILKP
jgi:hypothetical protein